MTELESEFHRETSRGALCVPGWVTRHRLVAASVAIIAACALLSVGAPFLAPYDPTYMDYRAPLAGPSPVHPFGTDNFGRDVFSRVLYGLRTSLAVAVATVALAAAVGVPFGVVAGMYEGLWEQLIMRPMDVVMAFPAILLAVALSGVWGGGFWVVVLTIGFVYVPIFVRVTRAAVLQVKHELFVDGARARGARPLRLLTLHIVPNSLPPIVVQASIQAGIAVLVEAALSFIGLGTQPPTPSLGLMLSEGRDFMRQAPWVVLFPGLSITVLVLGFNMLADGLRDLLDPRGGSR